MCSKSVKTPEPAPYIPAVQETDAGVTASRDSERRRRASATGRKSTMLTGGQGSRGMSGGGKTLLGQ